MATLIISLLLFESVDVGATRDSTIQQILEGRWKDAVTNAKIVLTHQPEDDLILGLLKLGKLKRFISELNPKFTDLLDKRKYEILKAWETFYKRNLTNSNILQALAIVCIDIDTEKVYFYANKILESDPSNTFAYFIIGYTYEHNGEHDKAIRNYQRSLYLDTTSTDCIAVLANLYLMKGDYDNALAYYKKVPYDDTMYRVMHIGEIICELKRRNILGADSILRTLKSFETDARTINSLAKLSKYVNGMSTNSLSPHDSIVIFIPLIIRHMYMPRWPTNLAAVLTVNNQDIVNWTTDEEMLAKIYSLIDQEIEVIQYLEVVPKPTHIPAPQYPVSARQAGRKGKVIIQVLVDIDGTILAAKILLSSGFQELDKAAVEAAKKAIFEPVIQYGRPVRFWVTIPIKFDLTP